MVSKLRILAALLCILPVTAVEGAYRQLKPVSTKQRSEYSKQITQVLRGTTAPSDALIKNWYLNSLLAELTQPSAGKNAHLARTTIIQNLQTAADRAPAAHGKIRDAVYRYAGALVDPKNNFSPVAQYNAMLIIGMLNQQEGLQKQGTLPVPYTPALSKLGGAIKTNSKYNDAVQVAALIGLQRHARLDRVGATMDKRYKGGVVKLVTALLESECPNTRSPEGHAWMQRKAMAILGEFGWAGTDGSIVKTLDKIVRDEDASLAMRCTALDTLDKIRITSDPGLNVEETKLGLATTTIEICRTVSERLEKRYVERDNNGGGFTGGGGGYGGGGYGGGGYGGGGGGGDGYGGYGGGGGGGDGYGGYGGGGGYGRGGRGAEEEEEELKPQEDPLLTEARRDIKHRLGCVSKGLTKVAKLAPKDRQLSDLNKLIGGLMTSIDAEDLALSTFNDEVKKLATDIEEIFGIETEEEVRPQRMFGGFGGGGQGA